VGGEGHSVLDRSREVRRQPWRESRARSAPGIPRLQRRDNAEAACGGRPNLGINFDPSHLYWQGVDIPAAIRALGDSIFHVHAKDLAFDRQNVAINGVLDVKSYREMQARSWLFRSVGWGHDEHEWKRIVTALRLAGYDYVISIEHEDALASVDEGLKAAVDLLSRVILTEPPVEAWWT
jgi:sugar phosphate isomerase/epimerase